jgi:CRISPR-associated protein Cas5h
MKGALVSVDGNWAHFKKPETNNNPLTHDFITKTAFIGMIGAVLGVEREEMKKLFPRLSDDLVYGVEIRGAVKKESWAFKLRYAANLYEKRPVQMEFLKNPDYLVVVGLLNERSGEEFNRFVSALSKSEARFTPVLGLHNCPANLALVGLGDLTEREDEFQTRAFVTEDTPPGKILQTERFRVGIDRIPTYQNDDGWNPPDRYKRVFYPTEGREIFARGPHYDFIDGSRWVLI